MTTNVQFLGTNLVDMMNGLTMGRAVENKPVKVVTPAVAKDVALVSELLDALVNEMYEECKTASNFNEVLDKHQEQIQVLNSKISMTNIILKPQGAYLRGYWNGIQVFYISLGNAKLQANQYGEGFGIWSIVGKITCNGKTELCAKNCYNTCRSYENNIKTKIKNAIFTQLDAFVPTMVKAIKGLTYEKTYFRIHEDGDFFDMNYFDKWMQIADQLQGEKVVLMAYTKEPKLLKQINKINAEKSNVVLRFSIMEDTEQDIKDYIMTNEIPCYICLGTSKKNKETKKIFNTLVFPVRCMDNCKHCKKCYIKHTSLKTIFTKMH